MSHIRWELDRGGFVPGEKYPPANRRIKNPNPQIVGITIFANALLGFDGETLRDYSPWTYRKTLEVATREIDEWTDKPGRRSAQRQAYTTQFLSPGFVSLHSQRLPSEVYREWIPRQFGVLWVPTSRIGSGSTISLSEGVFDPETPVLVRCSGDSLIPVINGVARYPFNPNGNATNPDKGRMVYGFWVSET